MGGLRERNLLCEHGSDVIWQDAPRGKAILRTLEILQVYKEKKNVLVAACCWLRKKGGRRKAAGGSAGGYQGCAVRVYVEKNIKEGSRVSLPETWPHFLFVLSECLKLVFKHVVVSGVFSFQVSPHTFEGFNRSRL